MLSPTDKTGCTGCSFLADNLPSTLTHLHSRSTTLALVSRAPIDTILAFQKRMGWTHIPWYSSYESDFNYDFQVTLDKEKGQRLYNYREVGKEEEGERPGMSVFLNGEGEGKGDGVYHAYSAYQRGSEGVLGTYALLDLTPLGRQDGEGGAVGWLLHDEY